MSIEYVLASFPRLYHMAAGGSFNSIMRHGLLSTSALLDLFKVSGPDRDAIESAHRPDSVEISHPEIGRAIIRDQKPMSDDGLRRALAGKLEPSAWYRLLNRKVFFWLSEERLQRMVDAKAYRELRKTILTLDGRTLLTDYHHRVLLSPINSGCTKPFPHPRDERIFLPISEYPFEEWRKRRGNKDVAVELAIEGGVLDIEKYLLRVEEIGGGQGTEVLWKLGAR